MPGSLSSSACSLSSGTDVQHVPFSYSVTCQGPGFACRGKTDKEKHDEFKKMAKLYREQLKTPSTNLIPESCFSISSGRVLHPELQPFFRNFRNLCNLCTVLIFSS